MGLWSFLTSGLAARPVLTWMSPQTALEALALPDDIAKALKNAAGTVADFRAAMKIPAFKRAHDVHCGVLARQPWVAYHGDTPLAEQPAWLITSESGVAPRHLRWGVASDCFAYGSALIGFKLGSDGLPIDALHIPFGMWELDDNNVIKVNTAIPAEYRQRVVWLPLGYGSNGMLADAADTIADAIGIARAYRDRINNPIAQTTLTVSEDRWDQYTKEEREELRQLWVDGRKTENGSTSMKPAWITVDYSGDIPSDLFESGRNANRLDMANHAGLPASIVEGTKQGGSGTDMNYTGVANGASRNEVWDYGLQKYADAWEARLSLDDVCAPGHSIRVDASHFLSVPQLTTPQTSQD